MRVTRTVTVSATLTAVAALLLVGAASPTGGTTDPSSRSAVRGSTSGPSESVRATEPATIVSTSSPAPGQFAIEFGETVSDGVPRSGAGNIEVAGAVDVYSFDGVAGQRASLDVLDPNLDLEMTLSAPDGSGLFSAPLLRGVEVTLPRTGRYTLSVAQSPLFDLVTGTYSFQLLDAPGSP
jgi:hypothetical protein